MQIEQTYIARPGFRINESRIDVYATELEKIERSGPLTPERVVEAAKYEGHPLHEIFEWDDTKAAHLWRLKQARNLIASVLIERVRIEKGKKIASIDRAWHNVPSEKRYINSLEVHSKAPLEEEVLEQIMQRMKYWVKQYKNFPKVTDFLKSCIKRRKAKE